MCTLCAHVCVYSCILFCLLVSIKNIVFYFVVQLPRYIRVNQLKTTVPLVISALEQDGYVLCEHSHERLEKHFSVDPILPDVLTFHSSVSLTDHPLYLDSHIILQDKVCPLYQVHHMYTIWHDQLAIQIVLVCVTIAKLLVVWVPVHFMLLTYMYMYVQLHPLLRHIGITGSGSIFWYAFFAHAMCNCTYGHFYAVSIWMPLYIIIEMVVQWNATWIYFVLNCRPHAWWHSFWHHHLVAKS